MNPRKLKKDAKAATNVLFIILIVVLLLSASTVVILLTIGQPATAPRTVASGDTIKVNYIGRLVDGRVFDTSNYSIASNDALYPKSLSFTLRESSAYTPLQFTVGNGNLIRGFESGVIGMSLNETKVIEIPPELGYGSTNQSLLSTFSLTETIPVFMSGSQTAFSATYGVTPVIGLTVNEPTWGWLVRVVQVDTDADLVVVQNMPGVGDRLPVFGDPEAAKPTGWYVDVVSVDSTADQGAGIILIRHQLTESDAGNVQGMDQSTSFIIDQVDIANGTARKNLNGELIGVTIYFTVTLYAFV